MRIIINRFLDWLCDRIGVSICFDGDLLTPESPDDPWWYQQGGKP